MHMHGACRAATLNIDRRAAWCPVWPLAQAGRQRQATRPKLAVRGTFSPARAWRPPVVAFFARTLASRMPPTLTTARLCLRPFELADASAVQRLAGDKRVALAATTIPHPYPDGAAEAWISTHANSFTSKREVTFAVTLRDRPELVGAISLLDLSELHARGEVGYWIGVEYWNRGYCTEAFARIIPYAYEELGITKVVARCSSDNLASARVMEKVGLRREGLLVKHSLKHGQFDDVLVYGLVLPGRGE